jgi:chemotaxis protein CheX
MPSERFDVLIADDNAAVRSLIKELIEDEIPNCLVIEADNGSVALNKMSVQFFHLIITDINMPKVDGEKLIDNIKTLPSENHPQYILVISGTENEPNLDKFHNAKFMQKPINADVLIPFITICSENKPIKPKFKMNVEFVNPFISSTIKVLQKTCFTKATKKEVKLRTKDAMSGDISALVAMNCSDFNGSLALTFPEECFLKIASSMLGEDYNELTDDMVDAAGEICNQIFGLSKKSLNGDGFNIQRSIPTIIRGKNHQIKHLIHGPCISMLFETEHGEFAIEAVVK